MYIVLYHPLCKSCAYQISKEWEKNEDTYSIELLTYLNEEIRERKILSNMINNYFNNNYLIRFVNQSFFKSKLAPSSDFQYPFLLLKKGERYFIVNYNEIFDAGGVMKIDKVFVKNLFDQM